MRRRHSAGRLKITDGAAIMPDTRVAIADATDSRRLE
jgi:hypothetical protein